MIKNIRTVLTINFTTLVEKFFFEDFSICLDSLIWVSLPKLNYSFASPLGSSAYYALLYGVLQILVSSCFGYKHRAESSHLIYDLPKFICFDCSCS